MLSSDLLLYISDERKQFTRTSVVTFCISYRTNGKYILPSSDLSQIVHRECQVTHGGRLKSQEQSLSQIPHWASKVLSKSTSDDYQKPHRAKHQQFAGQPSASKAHWSWALPAPAWQHLLAQALLQKNTETLLDLAGTRGASVLLLSLN